MAYSPTPWTIVHQGPLSMEFSRQEYWSESPLPSPGELHHPGIKPGLLHCKQILHLLSHKGSKESNSNSSRKKKKKKVYLRSAKNSSSESVSMVHHTARREGLLYKGNTEVGGLGKRRPLEKQRVAAQGLLMGCLTVPQWLSSCPGRGLSSFCWALLSF